ncbi:Rdx family protein [candidate division KSB1 bacterium]|nr:Rdx family protein [candidate division KSB1 bacterium]
MAKAIEKQYNIKVEYITSGGGVFEVRKDGALIFSKKATGRFPTNEEILQQLER